MFLSIIIPYYNAQGSILETLRSIYNLGLEHDSFEVILVDDFSQIPAERILKGTIYNNLRIIRHTSNKKQGAGRNTGIRHALGDYLSFVDADDIVLTGICDAISLAKEHQPDIVACRYSKQNSNGELQIYGVKDTQGIVTSGPFFCDHYVDPSFSFCPCSYLFKKDFLYKTYSPFTENVFMEDSDWVARHLFYADTIYISSAIIYKYLFNAKSTIHSHSYAHLSGWIQTGYRKFLLSQEVSSTSEKYSSILEQDAQWNINGAMRKIWTINSIQAFYRSVKQDQWEFIKTMKWPSTTSFLINNQSLSICIFSILGPVLRVINQIKKRFKQ